MSKNNQPNKIELRSLFSQTRANLTTSERAISSQQITQKILTSPEIESATHICSFISYRDEVNTHPLINQLLSQHKQLYAPLIRGDQIYLKSFQSLSECVPGVKHILEPPPTNPTVDPRQIDLFVIPGLAFDSFGYRLGYGKGYYDRLLPATTGLRIGVCFTDQLCYQLPHAPWDIKMHRVITDTISLNYFPFPQKNASM